MVRFTIFIVAILACNTFAINFPHQVSVRYHRFKFHFCNGAILTDYWVLTSARCVYQLPPDGLYVRYGESDASTITTNRIKERVFHPKFKYFTQKNNLAMLLTIEKIVFIPGVVVPVGLQMRPVDDGETVFISGWKWNRVSFFFSYACVSHTEFIVVSGISKWCLTRRANKYILHNSAIRRLQGHK